MQWSTILEELKKLIPHTVWLRRLEAKDATEILLSGEARSQDGVYQFVNLLAYSQYFSEPELKTLESQKDSSENLVTFTIRCPLAIQREHDNDAVEKE